MKVLQVMPMLGVGGASRLMSEIIPLMNQHKDMEVDLLIGYCVDDIFMTGLKKAGIKILTLGYKRMYSPLNIFKISPYLKGYDIIHVHLFPSFYWVALANIFSNTPLIYTEHNTNNRRRDKWYLRPLEKWNYRKYKKIISISKQTQESLMSWVESDDYSKYVVVNNGVNLEKFHNVSNYSEKIYPKMLINVARFAPEKDQETIIRAMPLLDEDIHLVLLGVGPKMEKCEMLASELGVKNRIHFMGNQPDVPNWLWKADIGIQSSMWEGFGLTAVEMMAAGLPVVASNVEGLSQIVEGAGVLFTRGDYMALAEAIKKLFEDKSFYDKCKNACFERSKDYGIQKMVDAYLDVYYNVYKQKNENRNCSCNLQR